jgi:hypothetical protein
MSYTFEAPIKDPHAILRHSMDWAQKGWLQAGEAIQGLPEVISSAPTELVVDQVAQANGQVSWRVSGGLAGVNYTVTVRISTNQGRTDDRSILYKVRER